MKWLVCALLVWGVWACPAQGLAQPVSVEDQIKQGAELARDERFDEAITVWLGVLEQVSGADLATVTGYLGLAHKQKGQFPEAWYYLAWSSEISGGATSANVKGWLAEVDGALRKTHVKVRFQTRPAEATVWVTTAVVGEGGKGRQMVLRPRQGGTNWWMSPGTQSVVVKVGPREEKRLEFEVESAALGGVQVVVAELSGVGLVEVVGPQDEAEPPGRALEWSLLASGAVLAVGGGIFHWVAYTDNDALKGKYSKADDYPCGATAKGLYDKEYDDKVMGSAMTAYVLYGLGGLAMIGGLLVWEARSLTADEGGLVVMPVLMPDGSAGASLMWGW